MSDGQESRAIALADNADAQRVRTDESAHSSKRSASPAKRTAADMEDLTSASSQSTQMPERPHGDVEMQDRLSPLSPPSPVDGGRDLRDVNDRLNAQIKQVKHAAESDPIENGDKGYLVATAWLNKILARASDTAKEQKWPQEALTGELGKVDNSSIVPDSAFNKPPLLFLGTEIPFIPIRDDVMNRSEFQVLPQSAWDMLVSWYGLADDQSPIVRFAHDTASAPAVDRNIEYELRPLTIAVQRIQCKPKTGPRPPTPLSDQKPSQISVAPELVVSRQDKFQDFLTAAKRAAGIALDNKVRIWRRLDDVAATRSPVAAPDGHINAAVSHDDFVKMVEGVNYEIIPVKDQTNNPNYNGSARMDLFGVVDGQVIMLEPQSSHSVDNAASDLRPKKKDAADATDGVIDSGRSSPSGPATRARTQRVVRPRGSVGLVNLGNTCYMNSALQCISRIEELAIYFIDSRKWQEEINHDNPLGYNGKMAKAFGDFLNGLYQPGASAAYRPSAFKGALSYAQPMFSGYGQQDSQEFLSFLVDALHEDLNRIHKKPYTTNPDSEDDRVNDPEYIRQLGERYRANHHARNDSIATDLFNGFYKNTMVCPICDKISVTFDPYSLLTLQLPIDNTWQHEIYLVPRAGRPSLHKLDMDKHASIRSMKRILAGKAPGVDPSKLVVLESFNNRTWKFWRDDESVSEIQANDTICVYELPHVPSNPFRPQGSAVESEMDSPRGDHIVVPVHHRVESDRLDGRPVGHPTVIMVNREEAMSLDAIAMKVVSAVAKVTSKGYETEPLRDNGDTSAPEEPVVSDSSVPSEDGYVDITTSRSGQRPDVSDSVDTEASSLVRLGDSLTPAQRSMFRLKYFGTAKATGKFLGTDERLSDMESRVTMQHDRARDTPPGSADSDGIEDFDDDDASITSRPSSTGSDGGARSDADIVLGDTADGNRDVFAGDVQSDEDLPVLSVVRERRKKAGNGTRRIRARSPAPHVAPQPSRRFDALPDSDERAYYIRLDEGIVVEWSPEAWNKLFGAVPKSVGDANGYSLLDPGALELTTDAELEDKIARRSRRRQAGVTLDECFAETAKTETLSEDNAWYCSRCKELRLADKTLEIWTVPDILVVHLKRFSGDRGYRRDKVDVKVDFPIEGLDLTDRVGNKSDDKSCIYDLFAVDNHYGGLGGGHYTATAKNFFDNKWYDYNDSSVSSTTPERSVTPAAYLLFYRRRSTRPLGPPYLGDLVLRTRDNNNINDNGGGASSNDASSSDDDNDDPALEPGEASLDDSSPASRASSRLHGSSSHGPKAGRTMRAADPTTSASSLTGPDRTRPRQRRPRRRADGHRFSDSVTDSDSGEEETWSEGRPDGATMNVRTSVSDDEAERDDDHRQREKNRDEIDKIDIGDANVDDDEAIGMELDESPPSPPQSLPPPSPLRGGTVRWGGANVYESRDGGWGFENIDSLHGRGSSPDGNHLEDSDGGDQGDGQNGGRDGDVRR